jgi:disulfide bond formation protein DsbB
MKKIALYVAWIQATVATAGSLYFSYVLHWTPCELCWLQRIFIFPLAVILAVAIIKEIKDIEYIVLPLTFIGIAISIYHNLLQDGVIPEKFAICSAGVSCTIPYHLFFNFLTVPLLSLLALLVITACMFLYHYAKKKETIPV